MRTLCADEAVAWLAAWEALNPEVDINEGLYAPSINLGQSSPFKHLKSYQGLDSVILCRKLSIVKSLNKMYINLLILSSPGMGMLVGWLARQ